MDSKPDEPWRVQLRLDTVSRQLRQSELRCSNYREENDALQRRITELLAQKREPHCLDDVIHGGGG